MPEQVFSPHPDATPTEQAAWRVARLAGALATDYLGFKGLTTLVDNPIALRALEHLEEANRGPAAVPLGQIERLDGTAHSFDLSHAIRNIAASAEFRNRRERLWLSSLLLAVGDELAGMEPYYFDRGPDLEMIRHLRNGVAHGNRFDLRAGQPIRPAWFTGGRGARADGSSAPATTFVIRPELDGMRVLFDFMGPGDVLELVQHIEWRLLRVGNHDPVHNLYEQLPPSN